MEFIVKYLRPIWSSVFGFFYFIKAWLFITFSEDWRDRYNNNLSLWLDIKDIEGLKRFFRDVYSYTPDGFKGTKIEGILDHDSSELEFFTFFSDCDDQALWAHRKLKQLDIESYRVLFIGDKPWISHFDCVYKIDGKLYLFNYGNLREVVPNMMMETINDIFKNTKYQFKVMVIL